MSLSPAQQKAVHDYVTNSRYLLEAVAAIIDGRLLSEPRVNSREIIEALSAFKGLRRWSDPKMFWRTRCIITTAFQAGVFKDFNFQIKPGIGYCRKTDAPIKKEKLHLRKVQSQKTLESIVARYAS